MEIKTAELDEKSKKILARYWKIMFEGPPQYNDYLINIRDIHKRFKLMDLDDIWHMKK